MRTVTFKSILDGTVWRKGGEADQAQAADWARLTEFINTRVREGVEYEFWSELTLCEQRYFRDVWEATNYGAGVELYHADTDKYWLSNDSVLGTDVPGVSSKWDEIEQLERYVALEQTDQTKIGEVLRVAQRNPRVFRSNPGLLRFTIADTGIIPEDFSGTSVWVEFRVRPPEFTTEAYDAATTYFAGNLVYFATTGECYEAIDNNFSGQTPTAVAYWRKVEFPYVLASFVKRAVLADAIRAGGQHVKADGEEAAAYRFLTQAADNAGASQGQYDTAQVRTY